IICEHNLLPRLIQIAQSRLQCAYSALKLISDIGSCNNSLTQQVCGVGAVQFINYLLEITKPSITGGNIQVQHPILEGPDQISNVRREVLFLASNICACGHDEVQSVLLTDIPSRTTDIISLCHPESKEVRDAIWLIHNICCDEIRDLGYIIDANALDALLKWLRITGEEENKTKSNVELMNLSWQCIFKLLEFGQLDLLRKYNDILANQSNPKQVALEQIENMEGFPLFIKVEEFERVMIYIN
ncbi:MAG: hypothetical protein EZS28_052115, partial [Streblomastix strix]